MPKKTKDTAEKKVRKVSQKAVETTIIPLDFAKHTILVTLRSSMFTGNIKDHKLTNELLKDKGATKDKLAVRKNILSEDKKNAVNSLIQKTRIWFNNNSVPWNDHGQRMVRAEHFATVKAELEKQKRYVADLANDFADELPKIIEKDRVSLKEAFDIKDYPTREKLLESYGVEIVVDPVNIDFRVEGINSSMSRAIEEEIKKRAAESIVGTQLYLLENILVEMQHLLERLTIPNAEGEFVFKINSLKNIVDACEKIKTLSVIESPVITKLAENIINRVEAFDVDEIREKDLSRQIAAKETELEMSHIMGIMGGMSEEVAKD